LADISVLAMEDFTNLTLIIGKAWTLVASNLAPPGKWCKNFHGLLT
jgi:hypothetical protein